MNQSKGKNLKKAIQSGDLVKGILVFIPHPSVVEIMGYAGFDFVIIDTEHSSCGPLDTETIENLTRAANVANIAPLVRVAENDPVMIAKVLDAGALGIVAPRVRTTEDVTKLVRAAKYPPLGDRGSCTFTRATKYSSAYDDGYWHRANEETMVVPLIEEKEGIENLGEMLSVKGIDFVLAGPRDLAVSMGFSGNMSHPALKQYLDMVRETCRQKSIPVGGYVSPPFVESARRLINEGFRILVFNIDIGILYHTCRDMLRSLKAI